MQRCRGSGLCIAARGWRGSRRGSAEYFGVASHCLSRLLRRCLPPLSLWNGLITLTNTFLVGLHTCPRRIHVPSSKSPILAGLPRGDWICCLGQQFGGRPQRPLFYNFSVFPFRWGLPRILKIWGPGEKWPGWPPCFRPGFSDSKCWAGSQSVVYHCVQWPSCPKVKLC